MCIYKDGAGAASESALAAICGFEAATGTLDVSVDRRTFVQLLGLFREISFQQLGHWRVLDGTDGTVRWMGHSMVSGNLDTSYTFDVGN